MVQIPHPPVISPQSGTELSAAGEACEFQILDNGQNGWLHKCNTILYVTIDGSQPSINNFSFKGSSPVRFSLSKPCHIKACAITSDQLSSSVTEQKVSMSVSGGIGLLLEKTSRFAGVLVQKIQPGGSAWQQGSIQVSNYLVFALRLSAVLPGQRLYEMPLQEDVLS